MVKEVKCTCGEILYLYIRLKDIQDDIIKNEEEVKCSKCKKVWTWKFRVIK